MAERTSRARSWPKEVSGIRLEGIRRGELAIACLEDARKEAMHGNHLVALGRNADAQAYLMRIVSELKRAGDLGRFAEEEE